MPRIDASEALDRVRRLRAAIRLQMPVAIERGIRAGHEQHLSETVRLQTIFGGQRYIRDGRETALGDISEKWEKRKVALGFGPDRGHFTGTLHKAIAHPWASPRTRTGWLYDIRAAGKLIARWRLLGKRLAGGKRGPRDVVSQQLRDETGKYLDHYVADKAPGLGELPVDSRAREDAATRATTLSEFERIMSGLGFAVSGGVVTVPLSLRVKP